jgi:2-polyprenyl-3-methyl-5-hydroxy-6-metoxy-1,4-benzoquinol methylase
MNREDNIIDSWRANAGNWIEIIEANGIESRRLITNKAIIDAIVGVNPGTVLDIGCGEGWLAKELYDKGISVTGIDIVPELIERVKEKTPGQFMIASYDDLAQRNIHFPQLFDAIVINFALIGKESTEQLIHALPDYMDVSAKLFIQTLHPHSRKAINDYVSGWKQGSWDGLGDRFTQPYEWYFRTWEDWVQLLGDAGFGHVYVREIMHPHTGNPLSIIMESSFSKS